MYDQPHIPFAAKAMLGLAGFLLEAAGMATIEINEAIRLRRRRCRGRTLRPGSGTPLWNSLRSQLRPHLKRYGDQVNLGRVIGLPRQRINAYVTRGTEMPDAERTLQLVIWLAAVRAGKEPG
jgi:hypothetical protein